jgi:hypothetical protein
MLFWISSYVEYMALSLIKLLLSVTMISYLNSIYNYVRTYFLYFYYSSIAEFFFIVLYIIYKTRIILCFKTNFHQMVFFEKNILEFMSNNG